MKTEKTQRADVGFALRSLNGGYFDTNGIGESSIAGDVTLCEVFSTRERALEAKLEYDCAGDTEIVQIVRSIACVVIRGESV